jgi:hypothetical protein
LRDGRVVKGGEVVSADDPIVKGMPSSYFEPLDESVERATRRPGERRVLPGQAADVVLMSAEPEKRPARKRG